MVEVQYLERFGNNLFQYALGRIISDLKDYYFDAKKPGNFDKEVIDIDFSKRKTILTNPLILSLPHKVDYNKIISHNGKIILSGFFQNYQNIKPYKSIVKNMFSVSTQSRVEDVFSDDVVVTHIRIGDYLKHGFCLPVDYYANTFRDTGAKKLIIVTDTPSNPYISHLKTIFEDRVTVSCNSVWEDFVMLLSAKNIIISQSTFSWWAAFLSDATSIYYPNSYKNFWGTNSTDLRVDDEERYIYL